MAKKILLVGMVLDETEHRVLVTFDGQHDECWISKRAISRQSKRRRKPAPQPDGGKP
jgi:hypothetical protein